jgi:hypothetical protein
VRRFHGLLFNTHSRATSDSGVFTPPTRRDSVTPQTIPLDAANPRPLSTVSNAHRLSTISNASTVSSIVPFPDFDSSFEPPREEDEYDTGESDHGSQEAENEENEGDEDFTGGSSSDDSTLFRRPLFSTQELAELSAFYGVPVTGKGRLSFDFGASDDSSSADGAEIPVQEAQGNRVAWRRRFSRSANRTPSGFRRSVLGSIRSGFSGQTGSSPCRRLAAMLEQGMRNTFIGCLTERADIAFLQHRYPALLNQGVRNSYLPLDSEYSDVSEESSVVPSVTSSMHCRRFEHILGPSVRDSWMSGLFAMNFGQWYKDEYGEEEEPEPTPELSPYPEFDDETAAKVVSFLNTIGRDTQLINRRLRHVLAEWKWVGISCQHGLLYLQKHDMRYDEVVSTHEKLGRHVKDLREQLVTIKGFDIGFDDTLRSWLIDDREPKDVVAVVEMYEAKYKIMMDEFAAKKGPIMQEAIEEKDLMLPKIVEMKKAMKEELSASKKACLEKVAEKNKQKEEFTDEDIEERRTIRQLEYGVQYLDYIIGQIEEEMAAESVADTESEYESWLSSEEVEEELHDEDRDDLIGVKSESIEGLDGAPENWSDLDEWESIEDNSEDGINEDESSVDDEVKEIDGSHIYSSEDESNERDSNDGDSSNDEIDEIVASGNESSEYESSDEESSDEDEEAEAPDVCKPEFTAEEWASGVLEAERRGIVFDPLKMTLQEDQEIVLEILRAWRDVDSSLAHE